MIQELGENLRDLVEGYQGTSARNTALRQQTELRAQYQAARLAMADQDNERAERALLMREQEFGLRREAMQRQAAQEQQVADMQLGNLRSAYDQAASSQPIGPNPSGAASGPSAGFDAIGQKISDLEAMRGSVSPEALQMIGQELAMEAQSMADQEGRANLAGQIARMMEPGGTMIAGNQAPPMIGEEDGAMLMQAIESGAPLEVVQESLGELRQAYEFDINFSGAQQRVDSMVSSGLVDDRDARMWMANRAYIPRTPDGLKMLNALGKEMMFGQGDPFEEKVLLEGMKQGLSPEEALAYLPNQAAGPMPSGAVMGGGSPAVSLAPLVAQAQSEEELEEIAKSLDAGSLSREEGGQIASMLKQRRDELLGTVEGQREQAEKPGIFQHEAEDRGKAAGKAAEMRIEEEKLYGKAVQAVAGLPEEFQGFDAGPVSWMLAVEKVASSPLKVRKLVQWAEAQPGMEALAKAGRELVSAKQPSAADRQSGRSFADTRKFKDFFGDLLEGINTEEAFAQEQANRKPLRKTDGAKPKVLPGD